jgi:hypothetical protein
MGIIFERIQQLSYDVTSRNIVIFPVTTSSIDPGNSSTTTTSTTTYSTYVKKQVLTTKPACSFCRPAWPILRATIPATWEEIVMLRHRAKDLNIKLVNLYHQQQYHSTTEKASSTGTTKEAINHRVYNYSISLISFSSGEADFQSTQDKLLESGKTIGGADNVVGYGNDDLLSSGFLYDFGILYHLDHAHWGHDNEGWPYNQAHINRWERGLKGNTGYYAWKPWLIRHRLLQMREGDFVVYCDSSRHITPTLTIQHSFIPLLNALVLNANVTLGNMLGISTWFYNAQMSEVFGKPNPYHEPNGVIEKHLGPLFWSESIMCALVYEMRLCSEDYGETGPSKGGMMTANESCCKHYAFSPHIQASWSVWQKNDLTMRFFDDILSQFRPFLMGWGADQNVLTMMGTKWGLSYIDIGEGRTDSLVTKNPNSALKLFTALKHSESSSHLFRQLQNEKLLP